MICQKFNNNVCKSSIELPNKSVKDIKDISIKSNINSPLPKFNSKKYISKDYPTSNNNDSNNNDDKIMNTNIFQSSINLPKTTCILPLLNQYILLQLHLASN